MLIHQKFRSCKILKEFLIIMQLNNVVFPAPECSYNLKDFPGELIFVPRNYSETILNVRKRSLKQKTAATLQYQNKTFDQQSENPKFKLKKHQEDIGVISHAEISSPRTPKNGVNDFHSKEEEKHSQELNTSESQHIPCLFLPYLNQNSCLQNESKTLVTDIGEQVSQTFTKFKKPSKVVLFFHGNAEDLGSVRIVLKHQIAKEMKVTIVAVEYSGYGLFVGEKNADRVLEDCLAVYDFVKHEMNVADEDIILMGRSLGSSPSCYIAKERPNVGSLILISPFKSLREVAKDRVGKILSYLLAERYRNVDLIECVKCPVLIIHGMNDKLIDVSHSYTLKSHCGSQICKLITPDHMDHNNYNMSDDIIKPIKQFLRENGIRLHKILQRTYEMCIPTQVFKIPVAISNFDNKRLLGGEEKNRSSILSYQKPQKNRVSLTQDPFEGKAQKRVASVKEVQRQKNHSEILTNPYGIQQQAGNNSNFNTLNKGYHSKKFPQKVLMEDSVVNYTQNQTEQVQTEEQFQVQQFNIERMDHFLNQYEKRMSEKTYELPGSKPQTNSLRNHQPSTLQAQKQFSNSIQSSMIGLKLEPINAVTERINNNSKSKFQKMDSDLKLPKIKRNRETQLQMSKVFGPNLKSNDAKYYYGDSPFSKIMNSNQSSSKRTPESFNLSPQSVKQSLPPGCSSVEGAVNSNMNSNSQQSSKIGKKFKDNNQSLSYIDLLNEDNNGKGSKEMEGGVQDDEIDIMACLDHDDMIDYESIIEQVQQQPYEDFGHHTAQTEFNQHIISTSEQNDYLFDQLVKKNNFIYDSIQEEDPLDNLGLERQYSSPTICKNDENVMENKNESDQEDSPDKRKKFQQLELSIMGPQGNSRCGSYATQGTLVTQPAAFYQKTEEDPIILKNNLIQYRTHKHTQKNSLNSQNSCNLIRQMRQYKSTRILQTGRFMSLPCNQQASLLKIKDKKLASPMRCKKILGDINDDIPQMTTDEQVQKMTQQIQNTEHYYHQKTEENQIIKVIKIGLCAENFDNDSIDEDLEQAQMQISPYDKMNSVNQIYDIERKFNGMQTKNNTNSQNAFTTQVTLANPYQTYQTTKVGRDSGPPNRIQAITSQTIGSQYDHNYLSANHPNSGDILSQGNTYQLQKEAMQKNHIRMKRKKRQEQYRQNFDLVIQKDSDKTTPQASSILQIFNQKYQQQDQDANTQKQEQKIDEKQIKRIEQQRPYSEDIGKNTTNFWSRFKRDQSKTNKNRKSSWWGCLKPNNQKA